MVAICIPTYNRIEYTKRCIDSFLKYTDFSLVTHYKIFDNTSVDGTLDYLKTLDIPFKVGIYRNAWAGWNEFLDEIKNDSSVKYVGKIDNDVTFTRPWIGTIVKEFENNPKIGSIRYGTAKSYNTVSNLKLTDGYDGGLKVVKKDLAIPLTSEVHVKLGSDKMSKHITNQGFYNSSMEVGICMADLIKNNKK